MVMTRINPMISFMVGAPLFWVLTFDSKLKLSLNTFFVKSVFAITVKTGYN